MEGNEKADAAEVVRMTETDGFKVLSEWIDKRVLTLTAKVLSGEGDVAVSGLEKYKTGAGSKVEVTVVSMTKDRDRHEILTWQLLRQKLGAYEKLARDGDK